MVTSDGLNSRESSYIKKTRRAERNGSWPISRQAPEHERLTTTIICYGRIAAILLVHATAQQFGLGIGS